MQKLVLQTPDKAHAPTSLRLFPGLKIRSFVTHDPHDLEIQRPKLVETF